jgi:hypothetical protein
MAARDQCLAKVSVLIEEQLQLLNLSLFILQKNRALFEEREFVCSLPEEVKTVVANMALAGGQSIVTIQEFAKKRGIPVRDCFPIARSAVETLINATYVLAGGEQLAKKAIRHTQQRFYRDLERKVGRGEYAMHITASHKPNLDEHAELKSALEEFTSAQGRERNWTDDSVPIRIEKIGQVLGAAPASGLLGAYALIYADGSEIIHGSLFGIQFFYRGRSTLPETVADFDALTAEHLAAIMFAIFMALNSYLRAFCMVQRFEVIDHQLKDLFDKFLQVVRNADE